MDESFYYDLDSPPDSTDESIEVVYKEDDVINTKSTKWE